MEAFNLTDANAQAYASAAKQQSLGHFSEQYGSDYGFGFFYPPGAKLTDGIPEDFRWIVHPHWDQFPPVSPLYMYCIAFFWFFLWVINFTGNFLVMYLFLKTRYLRSPSNMLIVNLAFADWMMMTSQSPPFFHTVMGSGHWELGAFGCELAAFFATVCGMVAIYSMVFIAFDRYNVIVKGFNGIKVTSSKALLMLAFIWGWVLLWNFLPLFRVWGAYAPEGLMASCGVDYLTIDANTKSYCTSLFICAYVFPLLLLVFFYSQIVKAVWDHEEAMREQARKMNVESLRNDDNKKMSAECRIAKVAMTNVFLWTAIWTPYAVVVMTGVWGNRDSISPLYSQFPALIAKTASCMNPIVYAISHPRYRQALQEALPWFCISQKSEDDTKSVGSVETTVAEKE